MIFNSFIFFLFDSWCIVGFFFEIEVNRTPKEGVRPHSMINVFFTLNRLIIS